MPKESQQHKVVSAGVVFTIAGTRGPSSIVNRYKLGKMANETLHLTPFEALFLFFKNRIKPENSYFSDAASLMAELLPATNDLLLYTVYEKVKLRGLYVKRESDSLFFRKTPKEDFQGPLNVIKESSYLSFPELLSLESSLIAAVDDENDITFFRAEAVNPEGIRNPDELSQVKISSVSDRSLVSSGRVPGWIGNDYRGVRFLTELEDCLLRTARDEAQTCSETEIFRIYSDLVKRKLIVKTGFKYGTNFRAYTKDIESHADYLIHIHSEREEWYKISRAVRVAHGVHKKMIFAGFFENRIKYVSVERLRDPFLL